MAYQLNNLISDILEPVADDIEGSQEVCSTEDFLNSLDNLNTRLMKNNLPEAIVRDHEKLFILGVDAVSLYPSMCKHETAKVVKKYMMMSKGDFTGWN